MPTPPLRGHACPANDGLGMPPRYSSIDGGKGSDHFSERPENASDPSRD